MITFSELGKYGRRGNQLFQAAAVIALSIKYCDDYIFPNCALTGTTMIPSEKFSLITTSNWPNIKFEEPHFHYAGIPYNIKYRGGLFNIKGYFQSYKYFQDEENIVKKLLSPPQIFNHEEYTSIHVRRGDYLIHKGCYNILDKKYYNDAMQKSEGNKFLIFSDDINWCKNFFGNSNQFEFVEGNQDYIDMGLMIGCSNHIIANSSFSYWGAYLGINPNKKIFYPKKWFDYKIINDTKDLCPPGWTPI